MAKAKQAGFTLIEIVLVTAISGLLIVIVFAGQGTIRARTQFDAGINKIVANVSDARNEATAGVNLGGNGDGATADCPGHTSDPTRKYVFAGTMWQGDNSGGTAKFNLYYYKAEVVYPAGQESEQLTGNACTFQANALGLTSPMQINPTSVPAKQGYRLLFVRTETSALKVCEITDMTLPLDSNMAGSPNVGDVFGGGTCSPPPAATSSSSFNFMLQDPDGRQSHIFVDSSGLASRRD